MKSILMAFLVAANLPQAANAQLGYFEMTHSNQAISWNYYNYCYRPEGPFDLELEYLKDQADTKCAPQSAKLYRVESFRFKCDEAKKVYQSNIIAYYSCL